MTVRTIENGAMPEWLLPMWADFFSRSHPYPDGCDIFQELFETDLMPLQRKAELKRMIWLLRSVVPVPVRTIMEIGTDRCSTLYHWLRAFPRIEKAVAVEIRGMPMAGLFEQNFPHVKFCWVPTSSYAPAAVDKVAKFLGEDKLDYLFIDGDKEQFETDFWLYRPMVADAGLIAMHDVFDNDSQMQNAYRNTSRFFKDRHVVIDHGDSDRLKEDQLMNPGRQHNTHEEWLRAWCYASCGYGCVVAGSGPVNKP